MNLPADVLETIDVDRSVLVFIDVQRRHMDLEVGYHTLPAARAETVLRQGSRAVAAAREARMRVLHVGTWSRPPTAWGQVDGGNPFMRWQTGKPIPGGGFVRRSGVCLEGTPYAEFMPGFVPEPDEPVVIKKRYSAFYATDLERVLRTLGAQTLFVGGVNTNNCVLGTVFDAHARDFRVVVLEDACGSMNGDPYHEAALRQIEAALGWTLRVDAFLEWLAAAAASGPEAPAPVGGRP